MGARRSIIAECVLDGKFSMERLPEDVLDQIMGHWLGGRYRQMADAVILATASNSIWFVMRRVCRELAWGLNDECNLGSNVFPSGDFSDDTWCQECRR